METPDRALPVVARRENVFRRHEVEIAAAVGLRLGPRCRHPRKRRSRTLIEAEVLRVIISVLRLAVELGRAKEGLPGDGLVGLIKHDGFPRRKMLAPVEACAHSP